MDGHTTLFWIAKGLLTQQGFCHCGTKACSSKDTWTTPQNRRIKVPWPSACRIGQLMGWRCICASEARPTGPKAAHVTCFLDPNPQSGLSGPAILQQGIHGGLIASTRGASLFHSFTVTMVRKYPSQRPAMTNCEILPDVCIKFDRR